MGRKGWPMAWFAATFDWNDRSFSRSVTTDEAALRVLFFSLNLRGFVPDDRG